jgi:hypothetical protein
MVGTFILLVLIPALLIISNKSKIGIVKLYTGESISPELVEPANPEKQGYFWLYASVLILVFLIIRILMM